MFFGKILKKMQVEEKNPINRMYLNEIAIKWNKLEKTIDDVRTGACGYDVLATMLTEFTAELINPKYVSTRSKGGFKPNSPLFSTAYLDDVLSLLIEQSGVLGNKSFKWGYQSYTTNMRFNPLRSLAKDKQSILTCQKSPRFLSLVQEVDFQFKTLDAKNYQKERLEYPVIIAMTKQTLSEEDLIIFDYDSKKAKNTFYRSYSVVVTEYIEKGFYPNLSHTYVDAIFVLRKQHTGARKAQAIHANILEKIKDRFTAAIFEEEAKITSFRQNGVIE